MERLQKILSHAGVASRRAAEQLMLQGRVTVNGVTVRELGTRADPARDDVRVDGRRIRTPGRRRYILINKPRGYVTTRSDPQRRRTVMDLLAERRAITPHEYVYPVGRLDFDSEGLLLLTNDGDLAARLTHPRHEIPREYEARLLGVPDDRDLERLRSGIVIDGQRTAPADVRARPRHEADRERDAAATTIRVTIREGRNRQIRKMCEAIGHPVTRLRRIAIGPITDPQLKSGEWRELSAAEVEALKNPRSSHTADTKGTGERRGPKGRNDTKGRRNPRKRTRDQ
jgi:pseudouridine synthase